ncbi:hypothetical protein [Desulfallas thermosapovorans]|uniref:hypothetical protein n=1 Tax=Desulfallas thermosapovorans TaxID=58137 RepID=UPI001A9A7518|nr:hypothetical protein [Desulfallas thermosapovorans]
MAKYRTLQQKKRAFLAAFAEVGNITRAAEIAGIDRKNHYDWMKNDPDYPELFYEADQQACDRLEQEARRRAVEGVQKPVFQGGKQVGVVQEYSDTLLIFLLKGAMPEKYKERVHQEHTGKGGGPIQHEVDLSGLSDAELDALISEAAKGITGQGAD